MRSDDMALPTMLLEVLHHITPPHQNETLAMRKPKENAEIRVFYSYSHKDEIYREQLEEHLAIFKRLELVQSWSDRKILPGKDWQKEIDNNLRTADLILLLVSSSFIASDYCYDTELTLAMSRHESGDACVVPIFVRPAEWQNTPFSGIQGLPKDALTVSEWMNQDLAWQSVATGLRAIIEEIREQKERPAAVEMKTLQQALTQYVEKIDHLYNCKDVSDIEGLPTGLLDLDRMINGLHKGELIVLASRPTMGKTALALNITSSIAEGGLPVVIFSTKLSAQEVVRRMITSRGRINFHAIGTGRLQDDDWSKLTAAISHLIDTSVLIDDSPSVKLSELRERCIREKQKFGALALVLIDTVQYLDFDLDNKEEVRSVGRYLKSLARELDTTILVTSQVPREVEARPNKRPVLGDVDRTLNLADEADVVMFIYLDAHYSPESPERGTAELIIAKNHFGSIGTIRLSHSGQYGTFQNYTKDE